MIDVREGDDAEPAVLGEFAQEERQRDRIRPAREPDEHTAPRRTQACRRMVRRTCWRRRVMTSGWPLGLLELSFVPEWLSRLEHASHKAGEVLSAGGQTRTCRPRAYETRALTG